MLVIDPEECIDCTLCEPECPVEAIYSEDELPEGQEKFIELNAELASNWPVLTEAKDPPDDADDWRDVEEKLQYLDRGLYLLALSNQKTLYSNPCKES